MSYYERRRNPGEEALVAAPAPDAVEDEGMSGTTIALIAGGVLAAGGFAWWFYSSKKAGAEDAQTIQTGASTSTDASAPATTTETAPSTGTERKKPMAFGTKNAPVKSVTTDTTKSGRRGMGVKRGGAK
jgi:hypothetical protein